MLLDLKKKLNLTTKQFVIYSGIAIVAIIVIIISVRIGIKISQSKEKPRQSVFNVNVIKAKKSLLIETISAQSVIEGNPQAKVYPNAEVSGLFLYNSVKEGDFVYKDAPVAFIDRNKPGSDFMAAPVKSPISGIVTKLYFKDKGTYVTSQLPIAEVANINSVKIKINLGEQDLFKVKVGQPVVITSTYASDIKINARVSSVTPFIDNETFSGYLTVEIDNRNRTFTIGMSVDADIEIQQRNALVVPEKAILMGQDKTYIFLNNNGKAKSFNVKTGYTNGGNIELLTDLSEDEEIVTDGSFKLFDGASIKTNDAASSKPSESKSSKSEKKKK